MVVIARCTASHLAWVGYNEWLHQRTPRSHLPQLFIAVLAMKTHPSTLLLVGLLLLFGTGQCRPMRAFSWAAVPDRDLDSITRHSREAFYSPPAVHQESPNDRQKPRRSSASQTPYILGGLDHISQKVSRKAPSVISPVSKLFSSTSRRVSTCSGKACTQVVNSTKRIVRGATGHKKGKPDSHAATAMPSSGSGDISSGVEASHSSPLSSSPPRIEPSRIVREDLSKQPVRGQITSAEVRARFDAMNAGSTSERGRQRASGAAWEQSPSPVHSPKVRTRTSLRQLFASSPRHQTSSPL